MCFAADGRQQLRPDGRRSEPRTSPYRRGIGDPPQETVAGLLALAFARCAIASSPPGGTFLTGSHWCAQDGALERGVWYRRLRQPEGERLALAVPAVNSYISPVRRSVSVKVFPPVPLLNVMPVVPASGASTATYIVSAPVPSL